MTVDTNYDLISGVMNNTFDELSCEEVFELNEMCDEWQNEAIEAQEAEIAKPKTVKVKGPWVDGVQTVKEISLDEWTSYTPLNRRVKGEWFRVVKW